MLRDEREFPMSISSSSPAATSAARWSGCCGSRPTSTRLYTRLAASTDQTLAGIAAKAVGEAAYHVTHAATWVVRLGDGTTESHERAQLALWWVAPYVGELFTDDEISIAAADSGLGALPSALLAPVRARIGAVLGEATLEPPAAPTWSTRVGVGVCTPRRWATSSPSCSMSRAPTREPRGERHDHLGRRARGPGHPGPEIPVITWTTSG